MFKHTKIVATLGPASDSVEMIRSLHDEGMNVARLNFSHGSHEYFQKVIADIREVSEEIAIMLDTKGPEIRTGEMALGKVMLKAGQELIFTQEQVQGSMDKVTLNYSKLHKIDVGNKLLIDDGMIAAEVVEHVPEGIKVKILNGNFLGSRKTVTVQGHNVEIAFMSEKDRQDIEFAIDNNLDYIAASFVRKKEDISQMRKILESKGSAIRIISKIEHWEAVANIHDIIADSDGIMVARGDLGVEIALEKVPHIQQKIIAECNALGKPVIVATQMLESMKENPRPTRAEVSDVAQAILQGADAVMLSGETASGHYPVDSVRTMAKIAKEYDLRVKNKIEDSNLHYLEETRGYGIALFVTKAAFHASKELRTKAIITPTKSGFTARKVSRFKPHCPIYAITNSMTIFRQLQISWGVIPFFEPRIYETTEEMVSDLIAKLHDSHHILCDDRVVITAGHKLNEGTTNSLDIYNVRDILGKCRDEKKPCEHCQIP